MRVARLDLLRYGRFTDRRIPLAGGAPALHLVFGPNEAGKSTALAALEDFLFGIPTASAFGFLHEYQAMRVGAVLERGTGRLEALRRKGNKDTLLQPDGTPVVAGESALAPFLAGADRAFFERMFSLDHERLRRGGRDIVAARDTVGQMLFAAGAGVAGLGGLLKALGAEADTLWGARRAGYRRFTQAEDRLNEAEHALRELVVTAHKWQDLKRGYDEACETHAAVTRESEALSAELKRIARIRRVYRTVREKADLQAELAAMGTVTPLPHDAGTVLREARQEIADAGRTIDLLAGQRETAKAEREQLVVDEALLQRADDIAELRDRRAQIRAERADLPKRRGELAAAEASLRRLAGELDWQSADIDGLIRRIPPRARTAEIRTLLRLRGECHAANENAAAALGEAEARLAEAERRLAGTAPPVDLARLLAQLAAVRSGGDVAARIDTAEAELEAARDGVHRQICALTPAVAEEAALAAMPVPPRDAVQRLRDRSRELERRRGDCREDVRGAEEELRRRCTEQARTAAGSDAVTLKEVVELRSRRDRGWHLVRRAHVEGEDLAESDLAGFGASADALVAAYEDAVRRADEAADRRFDTAAIAGKLAEIARGVEEADDRLQSLKREEEALEQDARELASEWQLLWADTGLGPRPPDEMLEWMSLRDRILELVERRDAAARKVAALRREERQAVGRLAAELAALGEENPALEGQPLRVACEYALEFRQRHERLADQRSALEEERRAAAVDVAARRALAEKADLAWSDWQAKWRQACAALVPGAIASPEAVEARVDAVDEMRELEIRINDLRRERIDKIERDIATFARDVREIVEAVAPDCADLSPEDAVLVLERRLGEARSKRERCSELDRTIAARDADIAGCEAARRQARETVLGLMNLAGVEDIEALAAAIERSNAWRERRDRLERTIGMLADDGDGLPVADLEAECRSVDPDAVAAQEESVRASLREVQDRLIEAHARRGSARQAFEAIGGDDAAARAAADRQAALAEMEEIAEHYVRVRSAALLLNWSIERYRREKQAPLLARAGELFRMLTGGSFERLELEFGDADEPRLAGLRADGSKVGVGGMSDGAADQLYLALRVAAIEDYLERAEPLPFVADDLFINFDDRRAAAGFRVLGRLAEKCQVIFFTHHRHLVDIARATLGSTVSVVDLEREEVAA